MSLHNDKPKLHEAETYLGDGLYAHFDGFQIILRAPRGGIDHWVGLEPAVYRELVNFAYRSFRGDPDVAS